MREIKDYFKQTIVVQSIDEIEYMDTLTLKVPLLLTEVDVQDNLFSPFPNEAGQFFYFNSDFKNIETIEDGIFLRDWNLFYSEEKKLQKPVLDFSV